jgi:phosphoglycolate phosphatase-like HAD superfamily hydrolase
VTPAVVLDLDGVLAGTRHREHHLHRRPRDWDAFFAAAGDDPLLEEGAAVAREAVRRGRAVVYLSGRPERTRAATLDWLARRGLPDGPVVLRADGDRRPASVVKVAALRRLAARYRLEVLVDDDPEVVAAVRAAAAGGRRVVGEVMLATWQPRDAGLHRAQEQEGRT